MATEKPLRTDDDGNPTISVVIPIYNESPNLTDLTDRLEQVLESFPGYEIIYVNDGSSDDSRQIILGRCSRNSSVKLLSLTRNFGHQAAISAGLSEATGSAVCVMDGDLQDPPELIPDLAQRWQEGSDVVFAVRRKRKENALKRICYYLFSRLLSKVTAFEIPLDSGDFALMDRRIVDILNQLPEKNRFVRGLRSWIGLNQSGIEYERSARHGGAPKYSYRALVRLAYDGLTSFSDVPLRLATSLGIVFTVLSLLGIPIVVYVKLTMGARVVAGWSSTILLILLVSGVQFLLIGIMGEYIGRILQEVKGRPQFLVDDRVNFD
jgi:glycosyltransferase involved in cell wall biosynthesis